MPPFHVDVITNPLPDSMQVKTGDVLSILLIMVLLVFGGNKPV